MSLKFHLLWMKRAEFLIFDVKNGIYSPHLTIFYPVKEMHIGVLSQQCHSQRLTG